MNKQEELLQELESYELFVKTLEIPNLLVPIEFAKNEVFRTSSKS